MSRFPVLTTISILLKVLAVIVILVTAIAFASSLHRGWGFFLGLIAGLIPAVALWAYAEIIAVVLAIESNTYESRQALNAMAGRGPAPLMATNAPQAMPSSPIFSASSDPLRAMSAYGTSTRQAITLYPLSGSAGAPVRADVRGFPPGAVVRLIWRGADGQPRELAKLNAAPQGNATFSIAVPAMEPAGICQVEAIGSGSARAVAQFTVTASSIAQ